MDHWVKIRGSCTVELIFRELVEEIEAEVDEANQISRRQFKATRHNGAKLIVSQEGIAPQVRSVTFTRTDDAILAGRDFTEEEFIKATLTLNDDAQCRLRVNGRERQKW